jgi:hypothetical protein
MDSIVDSIFIDNLHIMFGEHYLLNTVNTIFRDMAPEYRNVMSKRLYFELNSETHELSQRSIDKQKEIMLDYLSNLLGEFFGKIKNNITRGGGINKLDEVKNYIRKNVSNIKPKFYT